MDKGDQQAQSTELKPGSISTFEGNKKQGPNKQGLKISYGPES